MNVKLCVWAALAIASGGLVACADTGPMQIGKDTYSISVRVPYTAPHQLRKDDGVLTTEGH